MPKLVQQTFLIALFLIEIFILRYVGADYHCYTFVVLFVVIVTASLFLWQRNKKGDKKPSLPLVVLRAFRMDLSGFLGILLFVYSTFQLGWVSTYLVDLFKEKESPDILIDFSYYLSILIFLEFLILPFFLLLLFAPKERKTPEISPDKRTLLITGVSNMNDQDSENFKKNELGEKSEWKKIRGWGTIFNALETFTHIKHIYLIHSKESKANSDNMPKGKKLEDLIKTWDSNIKIKYSEDLDFNDFENLFKLLKLNINRYQADNSLENREIVFNLSGGTSILTSVFTLLAIKGDRGASYIPQGKTNTAPLQPPIDVLSIEEHIEEILDRLEDRYFPKNDA